MDNRLGDVGFLSYEWDKAPAGVIDAYAGGTSLIGLDEAIRYFNRKQAKGLPSTSYEIPVYTGEGSWLALVLGVLGIPATAFATAYAKKAGEKMAERDFSDIGLKDVARKSMDALVRLIEMMKRRGKRIDWNSIKISWSPDANYAYIEDAEGHQIEVPSEYIKWYKEFPVSTLKKLAAPIAANRTMTVASRQPDGSILAVRIEAGESHLLHGEDEDSEDEFLFPELEHGVTLELEGLITRGNQATNSIGFQFKGHILNCVPDTGNVRKYKPAMFLHCKVVATVNRHVGSLTRLDYRPTLIILEVIQLESDSIDQASLF
ncbi:MAG TPA: hypothetical protein VD865_14965 [Stenotrophomonas sp.]|nr:hypothetical protein [Stenotrophomonas sp.]